MAQPIRRESRVKGDERRLTTTSYAILGLLSVQPWSPYQLAQQMARGLRFHWPRAESRVYMEPANLVAHGLAAPSEERTGQRKRTVYSITPKGREALRRWLAEPSAAPRLESEALLRSMFADNGTKEDLLATLRELRAQAADAWTRLMRQGADYLATGGPYPQRLHLIALNGKFLLGFTKVLEDWAAWAEQQVETWPDTARITDHDAAINVFRHVMGDDAVREIEELFAAHPRAPADIGGPQDEGTDHSTVR